MSGIPNYDCIEFERKTKTFSGVFTMALILTFIIGAIFGAYNALKVRAFICTLTDKANELAKSTEKPKIEPKSELYLKQQNENKYN